MPLRKHIVRVVGAVQANCYIVFDGAGPGSGENAGRAASACPGECVVIDPGGDAPEILRALRENNLKPAYIFLTHGHFDHIMAVSRLREETGAHVVMHCGDADIRALHPAPLRVAGLPDALADITVRGGEVFEADGLRFTWIHTPGHTPGSCVIVCEDALYTGDTLFAGDCGRCDLPGGSYAEMLCSLRKLAELPGDFQVFPGHEESTTLARERAGNSGMRDALRL